jgi:hypothetical protein
VTAWPISLDHLLKSFEGIKWIIFLIRNTLVSSVIPVVSLTDSYSLLLTRGHPESR